MTWRDCSNVFLVASLLVIWHGYNLNITHRRKSVPDMMAATLLLTLVSMATTVLGKSTRLDEVFAWKSLDYTFSSAQQREDLLSSGEFLPHRTMPLGLEVWRDKLFLTVPRRRAGVPAVLGYVNLTSTERSPLLTPYPNWATNSLPMPDEPEDSTHITTAFRIRADACNRLWIIDTGLADVGKGFGPFTAPKLLIYNLLDDKLLLRYNLKGTDYKAGSYFANIAVDVTDDACDDAYAYMPDLGTYGLLVFSLKNKDSWRIKHSYFYFDPLAADFNIDGFNFPLNDGIISSALSGINEDGYRTFYFHSLSSFNEFAVSTRILRNKDLADKSYHEFKNLGTRGENSQSAGTFFDEETGILFFTEVHNHAITCWNTINKSTMPGNIGIVASDNTSRAFIFPCDVKVDTDDNLWVLNNNIPRYISSDLDPNEYNYFVFKAAVKDAVRGTTCEADISPYSSFLKPSEMYHGPHHGPYSQQYWYSNSG